MSIKVGDWVAFQVKDCGDFFVGPQEGRSIGVHIDAVTKILPPDPHEVLKEAVVDAANQWCRASDSCEQKIAVEDLCGAVYALEKAQSPPDLVAELRKKLNAFNGDNAKEIDDLITALAAARLEMKR